MTTASVSTAPITVRVSNWTHPRKLIVKKDRIQFEVARTSDNCHNCPTCRSRADSIENFLLGGPYVWTWDMFDGGKWVSISHAKGKNNLQFLADAIGLSINDHSPQREQPQARAFATRLARDRREIQAYVNHWENRRTVIIEPSRVLFQVTLTCNHCNICARRVEHVSHALQQHPDVMHRWEYVEGYGDRRWISLPLRPQEDAVGLLNGVLGLRLSC